MNPTSPIVYLKKQLQFTSKEWLELSDEDKDDLKEWAVEEMNVLGVPVK